MTNEELADKWVEIRRHLGEAEMDPLCSSEYIMLRRSDYRAAKALIEALSIPKAAPTPTPEQQLRELVGKHECLSMELEQLPETYYSADWKWWDEDRKEHNLITTAKALTVVRGIVKGLCDEQPGSTDSISTRWYFAKELGIWVAIFRGRAINPRGSVGHDTELQAIDALLTAMQEAQ